MTGLSADTGAQAYWSEMTCGDVTKPGLFMHPPYRGGVGSTFAVFAPLTLPADVPAVFRCQIGKREGSDPGDGILFRVAVVAQDGAQDRAQVGTETMVAEQPWIEQAWTPLEADLCGAWRRCC